MSADTHGISLDTQHYDNILLLNIKPSGQPTRADFCRITPMLEATLYSAKSPYVGLLVDATEFKSWPLESAWGEFFLLGRKLSSEFDRIAIYGQHSWKNIAMRISGWFIATEIKVFKGKDEATHWIMSP